MKTNNKYTKLFGLIDEKMRLPHGVNKTQAS